MTRALVILATGFEEIEAVTVIDVLRRADVEVLVASLAESPVVGSHAIAIGADTSLDDVDEALLDAVILPGGMPGALNLKNDPRVLALLTRSQARGKLVAAICAAPTVLDAAGVLRGRRATGYPGFELASADYVEESVVEDGNVLTSRGVGTALEFSLRLVRRLVGADAERELGSRMLV